MNFDSPDPSAGRSSSGDLAGWVWCSRCGRCSLQSEAPRPALGLALCSYPDCDGTLALHGWIWSMVRQSHPEYPKEPERGRCYQGPESEVHDFTPKCGSCAEAS